MVPHQKCYKETFEVRVRTFAKLFELGERFKGELFVLMGYHIKRLNIQVVNGFFITFFFML